MAARPKIEIPKKEVEKAIKLSNGKMGRAAQLLNINWRTFRVIAEIYGIYKPSSNHDRKKIPLDEIFKGLHPQYPSSKIRTRLMKDGLKEEKCERCGITEWMGKPVQFDLEHKDGNSSNHSYENLEILCPNCHSQTDTYKSKNRT